MRWSLSKLGTHAKCAFKYKLKYILKLEEQRNQFSSRGVDQHKIIEEFIRGNIQQLPQELSFYHQFLTGLKEREIYPEHGIFLNDRWEPVDKDSPELWYTGFLDLKVLVRGPDGEPVEAIIYDWKTGKIYDDHQDQRELYSVGVYAEHPTLQRVRAIHVYIDLNKSREQIYGPSEMLQLRRKWEDKVRFVEQDESFIANPSFMCRYCSFSRHKGGPCQF